ncbi:MAG: hypothetical protein RR370_03705 [Synergistaceae bacterium]
MKFITSQKIKALFKGENVTLEIKNATLDGANHGCTGFIADNSTGRVVYIATDFGGGSGLFNDGKAIMYRTAQHNKDYMGGFNNFCDINHLKENVLNLMN